MKKFEHADAPDVETAVALLHQKPGGAAIAGGTDLLTEMKRRIRTPDRLVNLKSISRMRRIHPEEEALCIGALTTIAQIEKDPLIGRHAPMLAQAAAQVGSPQIRNSGTLGGNLCQNVRCGYYRHPDVRCWLKGGDACFARKGVNRHHAVFGKSPCVAVNPSNLAPALIALDARLWIAGAEGSKQIPVEALYRLPETDRRRQTILKESDLIVDIRIPLPSHPSVGTYLKVMERATWSFALVSAAVRIVWGEDRVKQARIVLGGVAGRPWRVQAAEALLDGKRIDEPLARRVSEAAVMHAVPLEWNIYKLSMVKNLVKRALLDMTG